MRYWWVNQNQTYRAEVRGGFMWSPKHNANGARNQFYENMRAVSPRDVVFSFREKELATNRRDDTPWGRFGDRSPGCKPRSLRGPSASRRLVPVLGRRKREHAASHPARRGADLDIRAGRASRV